MSACQRNSGCGLINILYIYIGYIYKNKNIIQIKEGEKCKMVLTCVNLRSLDSRGHCGGGSRFQGFFKGDAALFVDIKLY